MDEFSSTRGHTPTRTVDPRLLDALRGMAALYVVLHHAQWLLWGPLLSASGTTVVDRLIVAVTRTLSFGHQAVLVFFLISGFCIHYKQARQLASGASHQFSLDLG